MCVTTAWFVKLTGWLFYLLTFEHAFLIKIQIKYHYSHINSQKYKGEFYSMGSETKICWHLFPSQALMSWHEGRVQTESRRCVWWNIPSWCGPLSTTVSAPSLLKVSLTHWALLFRRQILLLADKLLFESLQSFSPFPSQRKIIWEIAISWEFNLSIVW